MISAVSQELSHWHIVVAWLIFLVSYFVFAVGRLPGTKIDRGAMAVIGAVMLFVFRVVTPQQAIASINFETIILLFAMMLIVARLHMAGFFEWITHLVIEHLKPQQLLPGVIFTSGILSAFLVNDVVCLFLAPLVLGICKRMRLNPLPYLLGLATASNIGSSATITGNPQNILVGSISGIHYLDFLRHLGPVALVGLFVDWAVLHWFYRREEAQADGVADDSGARGGAPTWPLIVTVGVLVGFFLGYPPALVAAVGAAVLLITRKSQPNALFQDVDWSLLVLFLGLFLIVGGAQQAGITHQLLGLAERLNLQNHILFAGVVVVLCNIVSNVPAVMLLKDLIPQFHDAHQAWLLLAMSSTLAGNLTITGSVANIIVVEKARGSAHISFWEYMKIGVPVTLLTLTLGMLWLMLVHYS